MFIIDHYFRNVLEVAKIHSSLLTDIIEFTEVPSMRHNLLALSVSTSLPWGSRLKHRNLGSI